MVFFILYTQVDFSTLMLEGSAFLYVLLVLCVTLISGESYFYNAGKLKVKNEMSDIEKVQIYKTTKIISWAIFEGLTLESLIYLMIEANWYFLIIGICTFFILMFLYPTSGEMKRDFKLENEFN